MNVYSGNQGLLVAVLASWLFAIALWTSDTLEMRQEIDLLIFLVRQGAQVIARGLLSVLDASM